MGSRTTLIGIFVGGALLLASGSVWAHHSLSAHFNLDKPITLRGTVTRLAWLNPHGRIYIDVKGTDGRTESWMVETGSPLRMERRGLKKGDFQIGAEVIVGGYASRDGGRTAAGLVVRFPERETATREAAFSLGR